MTSQLFDLLSTRVFHVSAALLASIIAIECLVAIWAAKGRGNWFLRAAGMWAAVAVWIPIEAYEAAWFFAGTSVLVVTGLLIADRSSKEASLHSRRPKRYSLKHLFLATLLAGLWLAIAVPAVRNYQPEKPLALLAACATFAVLAALACWCAAGPRRLVAAGLLVLSIPLASAVVWKCSNGLRAVRWLQFGVVGDSIHFWHDLALVAIIGAELMLLMLASIALARTAASGSGSMRRRATCILLLALALFAVAIPHGYIYLRMLEPAPPVTRFETPSNNYRRILAIADDCILLNPNELSITELAASASGAGAANEVTNMYDELFRLLDAPNAVDYDPERDANEAYWGARIPDSQKARALARALVAEGEAARKDKQIERLVDCALANVRLSVMFQRGGMTLDQIFSGVLNSIGCAELAHRREELSPELSRRIIAELRRAAAEREPLPVVFARGRNFHKRVYGWRWVWGEIITAWAEPSYRPEAETWRLFTHQSRTASILLQTDLAVRLYKHDHGHWPTRLAEITPEYLPAPPIDPQSGQPLVYRREDDKFVLYSVGWHGIDDGGVFANFAKYNESWHTGETGLDLDLATCIWEK